MTTRTQRCLAFLVTSVLLLGLVCLYSGPPRGLSVGTSLSSFKTHRFQSLYPGQIVAGAPEQLALTDVGDSPSEGAKVLGIFSQVFVISRPSRLDRRAIMERLRLALDIPWSYLDAISQDEPAVQAIMACLDSIRSNIRSRIFEWPTDLASGTLSRSSWDTSGAQFISSSPCFPPISAGSHPSKSSLGFSNDYLPISDTPSTLPHAAAGQAIRSRSATPLTCAKEDHVQGVRFRPELPSYMLLTTAKIACWHSHLAAIQRVADAGPLEQHGDEAESSAGSRRNPFLILEDDVDMEQDIAVKLRGVWDDLPVDWDVVYLGHCWSNESHYPALGMRSESLSTRSSVGLHPSFAPKCTHAYAINPASARRLLLYLTYPPFAYSRALDQALAWLVESKRLKAFSVVPSVVVQHKGSGSDIDRGADGLGSGWRDHLEHSILGV